MINGIELSPDGKPASLQEIFSAYHDGKFEYEDVFFDRLLGIPNFYFGFEPDPNQTFNHYQNEQGVYSGTPYRVIRHIVQNLKPGPNDKVYDLGCGYGRLPLYGALTTEATFIGIELLPHRVEAAKSAGEAHSVTRANFILGKIPDIDFSDGTMFYIFRAFKPATLTKVYSALSDLSQRKYVTLATLNMGDVAPPQEFKKVFEDPKPSGQLSIYRSR